VPRDPVAEGAEPAEPERSHRSLVLRIIAMVALLATAAAASGGLGTAAPPGPAGATATTDALETMLVAAVTDPSRGQEIEGLSRDLARSAEADNLDLPSTFAAMFPRPVSILAMLALDRDVDDFEEMGAGTNAAAAHYRRAADLAVALRPLRQNYAILFESAFTEQRRMAARTLDRVDGHDAIMAAEISVSDLADKGELQAPPLRDLAYSHPYALDVFFRHVDRKGAVEHGPLIMALEEGIVVASADDWRGGAGADTWGGGGLSPAAGNGVVIYSPASGRYYSYFHLSEVAVRRGQAVEKGAVLGRGGNTGVNARKKGHGGHLHLEIFDTASDKALSAWEIRTLLFD
jgi:hypothetical protein